MLGSVSSSLLAWVFVANDRQYGGRKVIGMGYGTGCFIAAPGQPDGLAACHHPLEQLSHAQAARMGPAVFAVAFGVVGASPVWPLVAA